MRFVANLMMIQGHVDCIAYIKVVVKQNLKPGEGAASNIISTTASKELISKNIYLVALLFSYKNSRYYVEQVVYKYLSRPFISVYLYIPVVFLVITTFFKKEKPSISVVNT